MMDVIETIVLNPRVKARPHWNFAISCARGAQHAYSFIAPPMLIHLMIEGRIRLYPHSASLVSLQIFDDTNPYRLKATMSIIADEIDRMAKLDDLGAQDYGLPLIDLRNGKN